MRHVYIYRIDIWILSGKFIVNIFDKDIACLFSFLGGIFGRAEISHCDDMPFLISL